MLVPGGAKGVGSWNFRVSELWLAGLWVKSEAGDVLRWADGECRCVVHQNPLYKRGEIFLRTVLWEACLGQG